MDDPISARYTWDTEAMTEAMAAHYRQALGPVGRGALLLLAVFVVATMVGVPLMVALDHRGPEDLRRTMAIVAAVSSAFWLYIFVGFRRKTFLRRQARKVFRSNPRLSTFIDWTIDSDHILLRTGTAEATILWPAFMKVVENLDGFLFYQSVQHFNWIPGRGFTSAESIRQFADLARSKVPNYVVLGECQFPAKPEPIGLDEL